MIIRLATAAVTLCALPGLTACNDSDSTAPGPRRSTVEISQRFLPQAPYGKEGSAAFVIFKRSGAPLARVGPVPSQPGPSPQPLGTLDLDPGMYGVVAYQIGCGADASCAERAPPPRRLQKLPLSCRADVDLGADGQIEVVVFVHPDRQECEIEAGADLGIARPEQAVPPGAGDLVEDRTDVAHVDCSRRPRFIREVLGGYPALDLARLPTAACVLQLEDGGPLDLLRVGGKWIDLRRDRQGYIP